MEEIIKEHTKVFTKKVFPNYYMLTKTYNLTIVEILNILYPVIKIKKRKTHSVRIYKDKHNIINLRLNNNDENKWAIEIKDNKNKKLYSETNYYYKKVNTNYYAELPTISDMDTPNNNLVYFDFVYENN